MSIPFLLVYAIVLASAAGACVKGLLTTGGAIAAVFVGVVTIALGGVPALILLLLFFGTSNLLGLWRKKQKASLGFEKGGARDQWQVLANGGPAVLGLAYGRFFGHFPPPCQLALFSAGLAEANADTWATEIGSAIGKSPKSIVTGKPIARGQSGGVSLQGTAAAAAGAALIGASLAALTAFHNGLRLGVLAAAAGFCGALIDSVLGATVQAQYTDGSGRILETCNQFNVPHHGLPWFRNDLVNLMAGLSAVALATALLSQR